MEMIFFAGGFFVGLCLVMFISNAIMQEGYNQGRKDQLEEEHLQDK